MSRILADKLAVEICNALKIDSANVRRIELVIAAGSVAEITIYRYLTKDDSELLPPIIEKYTVTGENQ